MVTLQLKLADGVAIPRLFVEYVGQGDSHKPPTIPTVGNIRGAGNCAADAEHVSSGTRVGLSERWGRLTRACSLTALGAAADAEAVGRQTSQLGQLSWRDQVAQLDQEKMELFAGRMTDILNGGMLSLLTSVGYETGLFEAMAGLPPASSERIASEAGLNERYVREWLNTMVTGKIVHYSPENGTYFLPPEHAASLTLAAGPDNLAALAHTIPLLARVREGIVQCFRKGGGVFYDQFPEFMALWAGLNEKTFARTLISKVIPLMPGMPTRLAEGIDVLEIGCGEGHSLNLLAGEYPASRFTGYEFRPEAVEEAASKAKSLGSTNVKFERTDISKLDESSAYDLVLAFDVIHDQAQPRVVLRNVAKGLRPDGIFLMVDIRASSDVHQNLDHPMGPFLYGTSTLHCMTVSLALDGEGLGTMWGEQKARELLAEAGFHEVAVRHVDGDNFNNFYVARKAQV